MAAEENTSNITQKTIYTRLEWLQEGKRLFGPDLKKWKFVCCACGHIQSFESIIKNNPQTDKEYLRGSIYYSCEGRINGKGKSAMYTKKEQLNSKNGCDYTCGGFFKLNMITVIDGEERVPVFDFYRGK